MPSQHTAGGPAVFSATSPWLASTSMSSVMPSNGLPCRITYSLRPLGRGLSEYVIRHGKPLLGMTDDIDVLASQGEVALKTAGPPAVCWLGIPLFVGDEAIGLIAVQSYD